MATVHAVFTLLILALFIVLVVEIASALADRRR